MNATSLSTSLLEQIEQEIAKLTAMRDAMLVALGATPDGRAASTAPAKPVVPVGTKMRVQQEQRDANRLAIARAIEERGPLTLHEVGLVIGRNTKTDRFAGAGVASTLNSNSGWFRETLAGNAVGGVSRCGVWDLTETGRAGLAAVDAEAEEPDEGKALPRLFLSTDQAGTPPAVLERTAERRAVVMQALSLTAAGFAFRPLYEYVEEQMRDVAPVSAGHRIGVSTTTILSDLKVLHAAGLVSRAGSPGGATIWGLTAKGRASLGAALPVVAASAR